MKIKDVDAEAVERSLRSAAELLKETAEVFVRFAQATEVWADAIKESAEILR